MNIKAWFMGMVIAVTSSFAMVTYAEPNLEGAGALPPDPEPGQCFIHKFYPAEYEYVIEQVMIAEGYVYYNVIDPVFEAGFVNVEVVPEFTDFITYPPVFGSEIVKIEVKPGDPIWKVKCCDKKHRHTDACEQACYVPQRPKYKKYEMQTTIEDGYYEEDFQASSFETIPTLVLVEDGRVEEVVVPPVFMDVKVYSLVHPGYMVWEEGTCKKWTCNPWDLQRALKDKGYYNGPLDGIVGKDTMSALDAFRADHGLGIHEEMDKETLDALGIEAK